MSDSGHSRPRWSRPKFVLVRFAQKATILLQNTNGRNVPEADVNYYLVFSSSMPRVLSALVCLLLCAPAYALTGNAPPASGFAARPIVMIVDSRGDLCTGTALEIGRASCRERV